MEATSYVYVHASYEDIPQIRHTSLHVYHTLSYLEIQPEIHSKAIDNNDVDIRYR